MAFTIPENIPITNEDLRISKDEMNMLWSEGYPTRDALLLLNLEGYIRSKRSSDGRWHLKYDPLDRRSEGTYGYNAEELCKVHDKELSHLRRNGLHIISFGRVALSQDGLIQTITPWIDDIEDVSAKTYNDQILPLLEQYAEEWRAEHIRSPGARPFSAADIGFDFSTSAMAEKPFLHDVDPYLRADEYPKFVKAAEL